MKKIITFILIVLVFSYAIPIKAITIGELKDSSSALSIEEVKNFNAIRGIDNEDLMTNSLFNAKISELEQKIGSNTIKIKDSILARDYDFKLEATMKFVDNMLSYYSVKFENEIIYEFTVDNFDITFTVINEIDICEKYGEYSDEFYLEKNKTIEYEIDCNNIYDDLIKEIGFSSIYSILYKENQKYLNEDVFIFTSVGSPYLLEDIEKIIKITDQTDGKIDDFIIDCCTYNLDDDDKIPVGNYKFRIVARDTNGNISFQWVNVSVVDNIAPYIEMNNLKLKYYETLTEEELLQMAEIHDETELTSVTIDCERYLVDSKTRPDIYFVSITAKDSWNNENKKIFEIDVIDDVAPVIVKNNCVISFPYTKLTDDEIKSLITATDEIDGKIINDSITYVDLDDYENNYNRIGQYRIKLTAKDCSDNEASATVTIFVRDTDYPEIDLSGYEIIVPDNITLTKEQLKEYLNQSIEIPCEGDYLLESEYFNDENPSGTYDLYIILEDGSIIETKISVMLEDTITPIIKENQFNPTPIIIASIIGVLMIGIIALGIFSYKKRH